MMKNKGKRNKRKNNSLGILNGVMKFLLFVFVLLTIGGVLILSSKLINVTVEGSNHYSKEEMQELLLYKDTDKNTLLFYLRHNYGETKEIPFIEKTDVRLIDRNTVNIQVYEKVVTGCIEYMGSYLYIDRDGIIVETSNERLPDVPIITGLEFSKLILHEPIEVDKPNVFQVILNLTQLINTYDIDVNIINFNNDLEVILFSKDVRILLGKRSNYDEQLAQLPNLLASIEEGSDVGRKDKKLLIDMKNYKEGQDKIIAIPVE